MAYEKPFRGKALSISASDVGRWQDVSKASQREKLTGTFDPTGLPVSNVMWAWVKNNSAADLPRFSVVGLANTPFLYTTEHHRPEFYEGRTLVFNSLEEYSSGGNARSANRHNFGVTLEPIASGDYGRVAFSDIVPVKVFCDSEAPTAFYYAAPLLGDTTRMLGVYRGPHKIIARGEAFNRGAADYWCLVNLDRSESWYGAAHGINALSIASSSLQYLGFSGLYTIYNQCYTGSGTAGSHTGICARYKVPVLIDYTIMVRPNGTVSSPGYDVEAKLQTVNAAGTLATAIKTDTFGFRSSKGDDEFSRSVATYAYYMFLDPDDDYLISVTTQSTSTATYNVDLSLKVTELH